MTHCNVKGDLIVMNPQRISPNSATFAESQALCTPPTPQQATQKSS